MNGNAFAAALADLAQQPPAILVAVMCAFAAGLLLGLGVRRDVDQRLGNEAGDTHAHLSTLPPPMPKPLAPPIVTRRVRAISGELRPSFDSRKAKAEL